MNVINVLVSSAVVLTLMGTMSSRPDETGAARAGGSPAGDKGPFVVVLGIAQDGGYPHAGCRKPCCARAWENPDRRRHVSCLAVVDPQSSSRWIIDATPDFREQLHALDAVFPAPRPPGIDGIFLSHAHVGHYTGLIHLGREVMGTKEVPVYAMPRMVDFLSNNGPWDQLVRLNNISIRPMSDGGVVALNERVSVTPFLVPHRDEYSETVGFRIDGPNRSVVYISDIDKWEQWGVSINGIVSEVSAAYLDATFYDGGEVPGRDMSEIPHPFMVQSMKLFEDLPAADKAKIRFIHLNHSNPAIQPGSEARNDVEKRGYRIAEEMEIFRL